MNDLFFACLDCKTFVDAGYRWAYNELEHPGIVERNNLIDVEAVRAATRYWNPPRDDLSRWLYDEVFPPLRLFFDEHEAHRITFGQEESFASFDGDYFDWIQVGYLLVPMPRYLVEVLQFTTCEQVCGYMDALEIPPAWWDVTWDPEPSLHVQGMRKFEELVQRQRGS
jgi:hypothetical protein